MDNTWLKTQFLLQPDKSKADLARLLGLDPPAISKMLAGMRQIKAQEYVAMRRFFGMPVDGERAVQAEQANALSYLLQPLAEPDADNRQDAWMMPAGLMARRTKAAPEQIKVFAIGDSTMAPDFQPGEHVLVDISDTRPSPPGVFLLSDGVGHILRQCEIVPQSQPLRIRLSAHNRKYDSYETPLEQANLIGRVIAKLQWL